jgi:hypothetical protein
MLNWGTLDWRHDTIQVSYAFRVRIRVKVRVKVRIRVRIRIRIRIRIRVRVRVRVRVRIRVRVRVGIRVRVRFMCIPEGSFTETSSCKIISKVYLNAKFGDIGLAAQQATGH